MKILFFFFILGLLFFALTLLFGFSFLRLLFGIRPANKTSVNKTSANKQNAKQTSKQTHTPPVIKKIITREEGEYVDFEEIKDS